LLRANQRGIELAAILRAVERIDRLRHWHTLAIVVIANHRTRGR